MSFRILTARGADLARWHELLSRLPDGLRDVHYLPEYALIHADAYGHEPFAAVLDEPAGFVLQVFVRRPLSALPFLAQHGAHGTFVDVAGPYGFGGPLDCAPDSPAAPERVRRFDAALCDYLGSERVASEFTCLHPLLDNHLVLQRAGTVAPAAEKEVVVIDLSVSEEQLWRQVSRGTRSSINLARRSGVVVERVAPGPAELQAFRALYLQTMRRRDAAPRWFLPEGYFEACVRRLGEGRVALFVARCEGETIAAYLLMHDARTAYYHFGGSDASWLDRRPNNLLMYETLLWARRSGLARYHLGGGVTVAGDDSLLRFKSAYGGRRATLYTYGRVHDEEVYRRLCELKIACEQAEHGAPLDRDYFPLYRR